MKILILLVILFGGTIVTCQFPVGKPLPELPDCTLVLVDGYQTPVALQDAIKFYAWNKSGVAQIELRMHDEIQLKAFFGSPQVTFIRIYFHDIGGNGLEKWILDTKNNFLSVSPFRNFTISVNYEIFAKTIRQTIRNMEPIANHSATLLTSIKKVLPNRTFHFELIGLGFGADIAARAAELLKKNGNFSLRSFTALEPEIMDLTDPKLRQNICNQSKIPEINQNLANEVSVLHIGTCLHVPLIPACNSNLNATMGHRDFFPNGGRGQLLGCAMNDKVCYRVRAKEIYAEAVAGLLFEAGSRFTSSQCLNFEQFQNSKCALCGRGECYEMDFHFLFAAHGRIYLYTNPSSPYSRGFNNFHP